MKKFLTTLLLTATFSAFSGQVERYISIDKKVLDAVITDLSAKPTIITTNGSTAIAQLKLKEIEELSQKIHEKLRRCGGFMAHNSLVEARGTLANKSKSLSIEIFSYDIDQQSTVLPIVEQVSEEKIRKMIIELSGFENRHYESESGVKSSQFILETWKRLTAHRSDVNVELFKHDQWAQPSIILTIKGSEMPEQIVVLGGHADSIALSGSTAPGADDNASGVSSITEVIRLLMTNNIKPKRTVQFMAYAAEEVGLLGSMEIARSYRKSAKRVVGVLQLDMTLFKGTPDKDIILISDYTNKAQNTFLGKLIDEYVRAPWGYSKCGNGCSDHASWSSMGYPASFPFETTLKDSNPHIHTINDTLENAGGTARHAVNFTKLATAFIIEMAN